MYTHASQIDELSIAELRQLLEKRERKLKVLQQRKESAAQMLASIDAFIERVQFGMRHGTAHKPDVPKPTPGEQSKPSMAPVQPTTSKKQSLVTVLVALLAKKSPQTVEQLTNGAVQAGYQSKAKSFRLIVNQTLVNNKAFRKVKRATYAVATKRVQKAKAKRVAKSKRGGHKGKK